MAKRILTRDGSTVDVKKQKQDEASTYLISEEEELLFNVDRFVSTKGLPRTRTPKNISDWKDSVAVALSFIRQACSSIRKTGNEDIFKVFKDKNIMSVLIAFTSCLKRMREFPLCMKSVRNEFLMELKCDATVSSDPPGPSVKKELCSNCSMVHAQVTLVPNDKPSLVHVQGGGDQFSIKVNNMLLILIEILTQMGIDVGGDGDVDGDEDEDGHRHGRAELIEMVMRGIRQLRSEMEQEDILLIELIKNNPECPKSAEYHKQKWWLVYRLTSFLDGKSNIGRKKLYWALKPVVDFTQDIAHQWHTFTYKHPTSKEKKLSARGDQQAANAWCAKVIARLEAQGICWNPKGKGKGKAK